MSSIKKLVWALGFQPRISCSQGKRISRLSYAHIYKNYSLCQRTGTGEQIRTASLSLRKRLLYPIELHRQITGPRAGSRTRILSLGPTRPHPLDHAQIGESGEIRTLVSWFTASLLNHSDTLSMKKCRRPTTRLPVLADALSHGACCTGWDSNPGFLPLGGMPGNRTLICGLQDHGSPIELAPRTWSGLPDSNRCADVGNVTSWPLDEDRENMERPATLEVAPAGWKPTALPLKLQSRGATLRSRTGLSALPKPRIASNA